MTTAAQLVAGGAAGVVVGLLVLWALRKVTGGPHGS